MIPENRIPTHPGEILSEEFLEPTGTTREELSMRIGVPVQHVHEIADGERAITPDIAMLLSQALDTSPDFWLDLQNAHDLALVRPFYGEARTTRRGRKHRELPGVTAQSTSSSQALRSADRPSRWSAAWTDAFNRPRGVPTSKWAPRKLVAADSLGFDEFRHRVRDLDLAARAGLGRVQCLEDLRREHIAANDRQVRRRVH